MAKKYIKCPRCELNYILEGEDYCSVCKNEMKHHEGDEEELLDFDDMDLCPVCGQNYIKEDQTMCDECRKKRNAEGTENDEAEETQEDWEENENDDLISAGSDIDADDDFNHGFEDVDVSASDDPFKVDDELLDDTPIDFAEDDDFEEDEDEEDSSSDKDDFEEVEVSDDDDYEEEDEEDFDDDDDDDMLSKKK